MSEQNTLYLIDGHALAYRQFHGLRWGQGGTNFTTSAGEPTNAVFGFTRRLLDLIEDPATTYVAVSFDRGLSGREVVYPEYKAHRDDMPEDLEIQMKRIEQIINAFNIPVLAVAGYEADDVIGTIAQQATATGVQTHIITGDRDLLQLVNEHVTVELPSKNGPDIYDIPAFIEKYQVRPDQWVDMKAFMGDSSDNIPGVSGIGEKTAAKLLLEYDTLNKVYEHAEEITGSAGKKIRAGKALAYLSQDLSRIMHDVPIKLVIDDCKTHDYDIERVLEIFDELEFRTLKNRLLKFVGEHADELALDLADEFAPPKPAHKDVDTVIVRDQTALAALVEKLANAKSIVWDVETTSLDQMQAELVGIALAIDGQTGYYIPIAHVDGGAGTMFEETVNDQLPMQIVLDALRGPMTDPRIGKWAHNASYDLVVTSQHGLDVKPVTFDSMIAEWLLDPTSKFLGLKDFSSHYLNVQMTPITALIGTGKKQKKISEISIDRVAPYAAADAAITYRAVEYLQPRLKSEDQVALYQQLELPLIPVLATIQQHGIMLDVPYLEAMSQRLSTRVIELEQEIFTSAGVAPFNLNSPKQLSEILFDTLELPHQGLKKTRSGYYSTDVVTLQKLVDDNPELDLTVVEKVQEYREFTKLKGTYVDALPELVYPSSGRVHTNYNQTGTSTGRLSSNNPNLQNIPIRTELGREVRRAFIAPPGSKLLAVDYSQVELRVLAHISGDETLLTAFAQGQDIHAATAAAVFSIPVEEVSYAQRSFAKRVNFGLIYGMGAYRLARDSELTLAEANKFIDTYFERLPRVKAYIDETGKQAQKDQFVTTLLGRKRYFYGLKSGSHNVREAERRAAINMPIQGTAADIMKQAMINLYDALREQNLQSRMILQVHDELVLEVPDNELETATRLVINIMESAYPLKAPLKANAQIGQNWRDMNEVS